MRNQKVKKLLALCLALCLTVGMAPAAFAAVPDGNEVVSPYALYIRDKGCTLEISGNTAKVEAWVEGYAGEATACKVDVVLQRLSSANRWGTAGSWTDYQEGTRASVSETATVTAGTTYRVKAIVTVYANGESETMTIYSDPVTA